MSVWQTFRCNKGWFLAAIVVALAGSILASLALPKTYTSRTRIILEADDALYSPLAQELSQVGVEINDLLSSTQGGEDFTSDPFVYAKIVHSPDFLARLRQACNTLPHAQVTKRHLKCSTDLSTGIITLQAESQDALTAKAIVDSATTLLQKTIGEYRSERAEQESKRRQVLLDKAKTEYLNSQKALGSFRDSHFGTLSPAAQSREEDLERETERLYEAYHTAALQKRQAEMLMHKQSAAFTSLEESSVAISASSPHWIANFLVWLFYALTLTVWVTLYKTKYVRKK